MVVIRASYNKMKPAETLMESAARDVAQGVTEDIQERENHHEGDLRPHRSLSGGQNDDPIEEGQQHAQRKYHTQASSPDEKDAVMVVHSPKYSRQPSDDSGRALYLASLSSNNFETKDPVEVC